MRKLWSRHQIGGLGGSYSVTMLKSGFRNKVGYHEGIIVFSLKTKK